MLAKLRKMKEDEGFTLVELLVVISVLGILAGIATFSLTSVNSDANSAACKADVATVNVAIQAYAARNNGTNAANIAALVPTYIQSDPGDVAYTGTPPATAGTTGACA